MPFATAVGAGAAGAPAGAAGPGAGVGSLSTAFPAASLAGAVVGAARPMQDSSTLPEHCFEFVRLPNGAQVVRNEHLGKVTSISIFSADNDHQVAQMMVDHANMKQHLDMINTQTARLESQQAPVKTHAGAIVPEDLQYVTGAASLAAAMGVVHHGVGVRDVGRGDEEEEAEEREEEGEAEEMQEEEESWFDSDEDSEDEEDLPGQMDAGQSRWEAGRLRSIKRFAKLPADLRVRLVDLMNLVYIIRIGGYPKARLTPEKAWGLFVHYWDDVNLSAARGGSASRSLAVGRSYLKWMLVSEKTAHLVNSLADVTGAYASILEHCETLKTLGFHTVANLLHSTDQAARALSLYRMSSAIHNTAGCFYGKVTEDCIGGMIVFEDVKALYCNLQYDSRQIVLFASAMRRGDFIGRGAMTIYTPITEYVYAFDAQYDDVSKFVAYSEDILENVYHFLTYHLDNSEMTEQQFADELAQVHWVERTRGTHEQEPTQAAGAFNVTYHMSQKYHRAKSFAQKLKAAGSPGLHFTDKIHMHTYTHIYIHTCIRTYVHTCMYVCMCICIYFDVCIYE